METKDKGKYQSIFHIQSKQKHLLLMFPNKNKLALCAGYDLNFQSLRVPQIKVFEDIEG